MPMKIPRAFWAVLLLLLSSCNPHLEGEAEIYFVGFGFETMFPITPENIVEESSRYGKVTVSDPRFQNLMALLDGAGAGSFYESATRVLIRDSNGTTICLDNYGGIGRPGQDRELDDATLERVETIILSLTAELAALPHSGLPLWAREATHAQIAATRNWARSDYSLMGRMPEPDATKALIVVEVVRISHRDRITPSLSAYRRAMAAHSESFELHFDGETKKLLRTLEYQ